MTDSSDQFVSCNQQAGKAYPNIYEAVELFKAEQTATEVSLMQLAAGGLPVRRRRKCTEGMKRDD